MKSSTLLRRFRFSLAGLLVVVTALCLVLGFQVSKTRRQQQAVAAIEALGGEVEYDFELDENRQQRLEFDANGKPIGFAKPPRLQRSDHRPRAGPPRVDSRLGDAHATRHPSHRRRRRQAPSGAAEMRSLAERSFAAVDGGALCDKRTRLMMNFDVRWRHSLYRAVG